MHSWLGRGRTLKAGITLCCLSAFVLFGWEQGVFGLILENEDWLEQFGHPTDSETGIIVSCYNLGCLVGCMVNFLIGEKFGRRQTMWFAMGWIIVGTALQTSAFTVAHLVVGRIVTGIGTGLKTSTVPTYQSELCTATSRGRLVSAETMFVGIGIVIAYWFDFGMTFVGGPVAWRLPVAIQALFAIGVIILLFALPESPRWLMRHGHEEEAIRVLCDVNDMEPDDDYVVAESHAIRQALEMESEAARSLFSVFKSDQIRTGYRVFLAWLIQMMNQVSGINLIVYYAPTALRSNVGLDTRLSQILAGCIQMMFPLGCLMPTFALDRMGRRATMMWGLGILAVCMVMVSALLSQSDGGASSLGTDFASASVAFFFLYMLIYGATVNSVPWVYVPELLPLYARTQGTAIGISSNWMWNFVVAMITPVVLNRLQWKAYLIFFATNALSVPLVYFLYPETGNMRLEDVDLIFTDGRNPVVVGEEMAKMKKAGVEIGLVGESAAKKDVAVVETENINELA